MSTKKKEKERINKRRKTKQNKDADDLIPEYVVRIAITMALERETSIDIYVIALHVGGVKGQVTLRRALVRSRQKLRECTCC